jgi:imidazolonepropionase-like amidohydrolase
MTRLTLGLSMCVGLALSGLLGGAAAAQDVAVRGEIVHTLAGQPIRDGIVLVQGGKISAVGPAAAVAIPPGTEVLSAAVVTPGLIDAHSVVGLTGYLNQPTDQDQLDTSEPMQPELRAVDAYNARERLVEWVRGFGVTTLHTGHAPGALISGQTLIAKTHGDTVDSAVIVPCAMIAATLGESAQATESGESPGTRSKLMSMLREELLAAQEYRRKLGDADASKRPDRDLRLEAMVELLERRVPLLVTAQRHQDISSALRVAREFDLRLVLDGGAEAYQLIDEIRAAGVPVIVHPTMTPAAGEMENATLELAARLHAAGIPIALQSGFEDYVPKTRIVLYEAAVAAAHGLGPEAALSAITIDAAKLLGIDARVGSLEPGKDGDLALYDGDPFEYTSHCVGVVIEGQVVSREPR